MTPRKEEGREEEESVFTPAVEGAEPSFPSLCVCVLIACDSCFKKSALSEGSRSK